jgi:hypothetical protein
VGEVRLCKLMKMIILCLYDVCLKEDRVVNKCTKNYYLRFSFIRV